MTRKMNIAEFIDIVKEYPIIYSRSGVTSGDVNSKEKNIAWAEIAKRLNETDTNRLKSKWRNLRDSYQKAVKFKKELEEIGQEHKYHPYRHENRMSFLLPHVLSTYETPDRKKRSIVDECEEYKIEKIIKGETLSFKVDSEVEYLLEDIEFPDIRKNDEEDNDKIQTIIHKFEGVVEEEIEQSIDVIDSDSNICYEEVESYSELELTKPDISSLKHTMEDIDLWLSSVKDSLSKLSKINRAKAKRDINAILSNYEIQQYEEEFKNYQK